MRGEEVGEEFHGVGADAGCVLVGGLGRGFRRGVWGGGGGVLGA